MRSYGIADKMVRVIAGIYAGFGCAVVDGNVTSDWFMIKSGGKQGCLMSGFRSYSMAGETWKITKSDERKTKNHLKKDSRERTKQRWVEELGSSQSGRTRQKVLVRQCGGLMR